MTNLQILYATKSTSLQYTSFQIERLIFHDASIIDVFQYFDPPTNSIRIIERYLITSNYIPLNGAINVLKPSNEGDKDSIYDNCIYATMSMPF